MLQARFVSPSSRQFVDALFELTGGDALNGSFEAVVSVARYAEAGTWNAAYFLASDLAGNWTYLVPANAHAVADTFPHATPSHPGPPGRGSGQ